MRDKFADVIYKEGSINKKICIVVADISPAGSIEKFRKKFPDRFLNTGVAEQSMVGVAAGMASKGFKPFCYTISTFSLYRPFEMIRVDICYQNLPVTIVGMGAGTIYSTLGGTHLTLEDISVARSIPNLNVLAPCDPLELEQVMKYLCKKNNKPTYLRIGKAGERIYTDKAKDIWKFGKIRNITEGSKICIMTYGPIIKKAFEVRQILQKKNISVNINSCHSLKPFDYKTLKQKFKIFKLILVIEDHSEIGGLSSIIKNFAFEQKYQGKIINFSLKDEFIHCYGDQDDLLSKHNISTKKITKKIFNEI
jgi:transketolase